MTYQMPNFADATSLFSAVRNATTSAGEVNNDSVKINKYDYQWKMSFNTDSIKKAQEIIFTRWLSKDDHPPLVFEQ